LIILTGTGRLTGRLIWASAWEGIKVTAIGKISAKLASILLILIRKLSFYDVDIKVINISRNINRFDK